MPHNSLINSNFVCGLKEHNFETCNHHYDDLIKQIHSTCTSHPSEWFNVRFALLTLEVEIRITLEEIPSEETNLRRLVQKALNLVAKAHETMAEHISNANRHLPKEVVEEIYMIRKPALSKLKLTMKKTDICERIYSDWLMGIYNGGDVSLSDIVEHYNAIYGLDMTDEEVYEGFRRIKQRKGKSGRMFDSSRNIYDLGYYTYEANRRLNQHILDTDMLEGGRPSRPEAYKGSEI